MIGRSPRRFAWSVFLPLLCGGAADAETFSEYELKAAFLYKFAQFVTWPNSPARDRFALCLFGSDPFQGRLASFAGKALNKVPVAVQYPLTLEAAKTCQVLFLNPVRPAELGNWTRELDNLPILTVSDAPGAWGDDVKIALVTEPNRISFRINLTAARQAGLELSSNLLKLAREIK
jgi:hypothetical protein